MIAAVQAHLLETLAEATTPQQAEALKGKLSRILQDAADADARAAAADAPRRLSSPPPRGARTGQRAQPKRKKPKRKRG